MNENAISIKNITMWSEEKPAAEAIFNEAFPETERILSLDELLEIQQSTGVYRVEAVCENDRVIAVFVYAPRSEYVYFVYFAVSSDLRGKGYGSKLFRIFLDRVPDKPVLFSVEAPIEGTSNYEQRVMRLAFYERLGITAMDYYIGLDAETMLMAATNRPDEKTATYYKDMITFLMSMEKSIVLNGVKSYLKKDGYLVEVPFDEWR